MERPQIHINWERETNLLYNEINDHAARFYYPYTPLFSSGRTTGTPSACFSHTQGYGGAAK
ncbi:MAG: hypothetical protein ACE5R6_08800 [Candidatus Heimdallarchaeota archaeon]